MAAENITTGRFPTNTGVNLFRTRRNTGNQRSVSIVSLRCNQRADEYRDLLRVSVATPSNDHRHWCQRSTTGYNIRSFGRWTHFNLSRCIEENTVYDKIYDKKWKSASISSCLSKGIRPIETELLLLPLPAINLNSRMLGSKSLNRMP